MVRKYIKRDFTDHEYSTEYLSDEDEYIRLEIFSFDPEFTRVFKPEDGSLFGENAVKTFWKSWQCFRSGDKISPMEFTLNYNVAESGLYRIDVLYEKSSYLYGGKGQSGNILNTNRDLIGWYDIFKAGTKAEHKAQTVADTEIVDKFAELEKSNPSTPTDSKILKELKQGALKDVISKTKTAVVETIGDIPEAPDTVKYAFRSKMTQRALEKANESDTDKDDTAISLPFEGENNVIKRKTLFRHLDDGDWKFEFAVPHNCYVMGFIVRKVLKFWGTNNDEAGSNLQFTDAKWTHSEVGKPCELEAKFGYDDDFECDLSPTGLYLDYMDECNLYVKNNAGVIKRVFGGYVSTPVPDADRKEITIHCADRLKDGENKYILDLLKLQGGTGDNKDYSTENIISFNKYSEVLAYSCRLYEISLNHNIDPNYNIVGEGKYKKGFSIDFGKKKNVKKITTNNCLSEVYKDSILLRNESSGKKKQVWTLFKAKKPIDISQYDYTDADGHHTCNFHITYGLGDPKTERKVKTTSNVDNAEGTAGSQKFGKCGVSADGKYIMGIGQYSGSKGTGGLSYNQIYKSIFINKCPHCGGTLVWDSGRSDSNCVHCGGYHGSKRTWGDIHETEITCKSCCADYDAITGYEKDAPWKKLTKVGKTVKSSKKEQNKLHNGEMTALAKSNVSVSSEDIFKAIRKTTKGWTHSTGTGSTASYLEKHHTGDCWAWSAKIGKELKKYKVNYKIVQYATGSSDNHRSVLYQNSDGKYVDFPYREYNFPNGTFNTSGSAHGKLVEHYKAGGRISQATVTGSTKKTETSETTITKGYDKEKPIQFYIDLVYSTSNSKKAKKYHAYLDFTQKAKSNDTISGLTPVWVNNASKTITLTDIVGKLQYYSGGTNIYLHQINLIAPKIKTTNSDKNTDWYTVDNATQDNSSCKMLLYNISFNNEMDNQPDELESCGKSVNELMQSIIEKTGYVVDMEYGEHRCDDKIHFKTNPSTTPVFTATEGNNNNILEWGNISYNPANEMFNMSMCVFKNNSSDLYNYVDSRFTDSILKYQEQCTLITENDPIGEKEAYWNARHNDKFNPEQVYNFTITVKGLPDVHLRELVEVIANSKKLSTLKECNSLVLTYDSGDKPILQTEMGLGELAPDLQVAKNIKELRDNAKKTTTSFFGTALPVMDSSIYEWD